MYHRARVQVKTLLNVSKKTHNLILNCYEKLVSIFFFVGKVTLVCRKKLFHTLFIISNSKCSNILAHDKLLYGYLVDIHIQLVVSQALRRAVNVAVVKLTNHRLNRTHQYIVLMDWI